MTVRPPRNRPIGFRKRLSLFRACSFHAKPAPAKTGRVSHAVQVIVFDYKDLQPEYILATAAGVLALGITYGLVSNR